MPFNESFNVKLKKTTAKLINILTNFSEDSENHASCMEFSLSNFYYHRFLSPENQKIQRQMQGLSEKFLIHSQPIKSECIKKSFNLFMLKDISNKTFANSSVHYSLIAILLNLSVHPLSEKYSEKVVSTSSPVKDNFDWTGYLLEGEDIPSFWSWNESPVASDDEAIVEPPLHDMEVKPAKCGEQILLGDQNDPKSVVNVKLVPSYWKAKKVVEKLSNLRISGKPVCLHNINMPTKELNVLREILWLFCGHKDLFIFPFKDGKHVVSQDVQLSHVTTESLRQSLIVFAKCGDIVHRLQQFVFTDVLHQSQTYEAFAASILLFFNWMKHGILSIEKRLTAREETILLKDVNEMLSHYIEILFVIDNIFECSIAIDKPDESNALKTSRLLYVLYEAIIDENNMLPDRSINEHKVAAADVVFNFWIDSIQPYIDVIDRWITLGSFDDPKKEFPLQRIQELSDCKQANFWKDAIFPVIDDIDKVCPWLSPLFKSIITGGKSMEILQTLSALCRSNREKSLDVLPPPNTGFKQSVYSYFLNSIANVKTLAQNSVVTNAAPKSQSRNNSDVLIKANFIRLFSQNTARSPVVSILDKRQKNQEPFPIAVVKSLKPIIDLKSNYANNRLLTVFKERFGLLEMLEAFHSYHLMGLGDVMHDFSTGLFQDLLSDGTFTNDLVGLNILMQEAVSGRHVGLQRVFVALKNVPNDLKKEGGLLAQPKPSNEIILSKHLKMDATDCIELQCNVEWPVNLVLSEQCIAVYNKVFSYLLQIKRAVFCVESLKFSTIYELRSRISQSETSSHASNKEGVSNNQKRHRMAILRNRILHLLQHWHAFVMTSVIQAEKHIFSQSIANATTLNHVLEAHQLFLDRICSLCLLDDKKQSCKLIQGTLKKIMVLAITFNMLWNHGIDHIPNRSILKHETDFREYSEFLGRILKTIANRGAVPILDSLAYAILL